MTNTSTFEALRRPGTSNAAAEPDVSDALTERSRRVWGAGDYDRISAGFREGAEWFVARRSFQPRQIVLDVACGSGNLTIPAARTKAYVTGLDLVPSLLAKAELWARSEGLSVALDEGNAEDLPYADAQFDVVMSMFGVMFAARPEKVVAELARVTRPGGQVVLANWTRSAFIGKMLAMHVARVAPPAGVPSPLAWADEEVLRSRFDERTWRLTTTVRALTFRYPYSPAGTAELFRAAYGPTVRTFEALDENQRALFAEELAAHWTAHNRAGDGSTEVEAEYLEVLAVRR
ncbi:MAG TPA: class I SAM-dependent methyltransferase [Gemmatimonadaceae bacterium]|nr:class I SAM-dependent methyltransferase [Gemmatimonadaceae bacterium]